MRAIEYRNRITEHRSEESQQALTTLHIALKRIATIPPSELSDAEIDQIAGLVKSAKQKDDYPESVIAMYEGRTASLQAIQRLEGEKVYEVLTEAQRKFDAATVLHDSLPSGTGKQKANAELTIVKIERDEAAHAVRKLEHARKQLVEFSAKLKRVEPQDEEPAARTTTKKNKLQAAGV